MVKWARIKFHPSFWSCSKLRVCKKLKQPQRGKRRKFAYLTIKNKNFARLARAGFTSAHFEAVLDQSTTLNDLSCSYEDNISITIFFSLLISKPLVPI